MTARGGSQGRAARTSRRGRRQEPEQAPAAAAQGDARPLPDMAAQAVLVAAVLCLGETVCSPIVTGFSSGAFALLPWATAACLLAVMFSYVVGFALLWCAEAVTGRLAPARRPPAYAVVGLVGYAAWRTLVFVPLLNGILVRVGHPVLDNGQVVALGVNGAALGCAAFFLAAALGRRLASHRVAVAVIAALTVATAVLGGVVLYSTVQAVA